MHGPGKTVGEIYLALLPLMLPDLSFSPPLVGWVVGYLTYILGVECYHAVFQSKNLIYLFIFTCPKEYMNNFLECYHEIRLVLFFFKGIKGIESVG